tara:strand:+ start:371 stop:1090 length:720 start_codon:yes stop_codon:yes gene_type:complete
MAKDLPYFKFFCSEWNDGDITLESYESQGLFVNICSYYWSNNCEVTLAKLKKKFKQDDLIDSLISEGIFKVEGDDVVISFLIEQLGERDTLSSQNSVNAKKRWDKIREEKRLKCESNATASKPQCESGTESMQYREEKKREEKKREDKPPTAFSFYNSLIELGATKQLSNEWLAIRKVKKATNSETAFKAFKTQVEKTKATVNEILELCVINSWKGYNCEWYKPEPSKAEYKRPKINFN